MPALSPDQRSLRSRIGAYATLARHDSRQINAVARATYRTSFRLGHACKVCPAFTMPPGLPESEVERRAEALRRAHYARLALRSSQARSRPSPEAA
jgi:hypothetical protein